MIRALLSQSIGTAVAAAVGLSSYALGCAEWAAGCFAGSSYMLARDVFEAWWDYRNGGVR